MDDIGLPKEMQQRIQAALREHNEMPKQTLMDHVIELRKEAGLGTEAAERPQSLMDHVIAAGERKIFMYASYPKNGFLGGKNF